MGTFEQLLELLAANPGCRVQWVLDDLRRGGQPDARYSDAECQLRLLIEEHERILDEDEEFERAEAQLKY